MRPRFPVAPVAVRRGVLAMRMTSFGHRMNQARSWVIMHGNWLNWSWLIRRGSDPPEEPLPRIHPLRGYHPHRSHHAQDLQHEDPEQHHPDGGSGSHRGGRRRSGGGEPRFPGEVFVEPAADDVARRNDVHDGESAQSGQVDFFGHVLSHVDVVCQGRSLQRRVSGFGQQGFEAEEKEDATDSQVYQLRNYHERHQRTRGLIADEASA